MPFPLAHPAAVLPLRRFCPRFLNFPALVIGSLTPDLGYAFGGLNVQYFSHRLLAGSFGFCLPVGLMLVLIFYLFRLSVVRLLPAHYQRAFLPFCRRPAGSPWATAISLVVGAWTHQWLDALTHPEFWLVRYMPGLLAPILQVGSHRILLCEALYAGCTFAGVAWLASAYLRWWEKATDAKIPRGIQMGCVLLLGGGILSIALVCRGSDRVTALGAAGIVSVLLVIGFPLAADWLSIQFRNPK
ncbi:MAG: DUF4184 family protein [Formivibrio sp.]|nr:DUF4184 family protein [Formivibrio sp.]